MHNRHSNCREVFICHYHMTLWGILWIANYIACD